eukprot:394085-Rhodomonas_salina.1
MQSLGQCRTSHHHCGRIQSACQTSSRCRKIGANAEDVITNASHLVANAGASDGWRMRNM